MSTFYAKYPVSGVGGVSIYPNFGAFPVGTTIGQLAVDASTGNLYEWNGTSWVIIGGPGSVISQIFGTRAAPLNITAAGGITFASLAAQVTIFVQGSGGAVTITKNPAIVNSSTAFIGQRVQLIFVSDTNTLRINNALGTDQNGDIIGTSNNAIEYEWDGTNWFELNRRA